MFRKIIAILAISMIGMVVSEDQILPEAEMFGTQINGDLVLVLNSNRDEQTPHQLVHMEPLKLHKNVDGLLHYAIGARTSSDRLVAQGGQNQTYPAPHNVQLQLTYPSQGYGAQVTYVAIVVNQTSSLGQAYVVKGGINQHLISVVVEAYNTYVFNVFAYVYGI